MLVKLALRNVRRSLKDFAVYFVTLVMGVALFYSFNSIGEQKVLFDLAATGGDFWDSIQDILRMFSVVVAFVLGFLVIYANNFLLRRRRQEFATYLLLGMNARQASFVILVETLAVGMGALVCGLALGFVLSQGMAFFSAAMFQIPMKEYQFIFSAAAFLFTVIAFAIIFVVVAVFNIVYMARRKLISLIGPSAQEQAYKARPLGLSVAAFVVSLVILAVAYKTLMDSGLLKIQLEGSFGVATLLMLIGTLLFFWSVSGAVMALVQRCPKLYLKGLTTFTLRQIASRVNAACVTLWAVCVLLFFSITTFSTGNGLAKMYADTIAEQTHFDATCTLYGSTWDPTERAYTTLDDEYIEQFKDAAENPVALLTTDYPEMMHDVTQAESISIWPLSFTFGELAEKTGVDIGGRNADGWLMKVPAVSESQFNAIRRMVGRPEVWCGEDGYLVVNTVDGIQDLAQATAAYDGTIDVYGVSLHSASDQVLRQGIQDSIVPSEDCIFVVPDAVIEKVKDQVEIPTSMVVNFNVEQAAKDELLSSNTTILGRTAFNVGFTSKDAVVYLSMNNRVLITYLAIYVGITLLISTAAILAIQQLSFASDSTGRYLTLAQLGAGRRQIMRSLRIQTLVYFLVPLGLACCHWACVFTTLQSSLFNMVGGDPGTAILFAGLLTLVVYGAYMAIAYFGARAVITASVPRRLL